MPPQLEHRAVRAAEIRVTPDARTFEAVVMVYGVVDDYETIFDPGCFTESLKGRLPRITWAHNWSDPIGRYVDYKDTATELTLIGELDDFAAVPRARQAYAQLQSGTIDQFSVGFAREQEADDDNGITHFVKARLDEAALVLAGAVPGTKLLALRSKTAGGLLAVREVPEATVIDLARKVAAGELTQAEAKAALGLLTDEPATEPVAVEPVTLDPDAAEDIATADDAMAALGIG